MHATASRWRCYLSRDLDIADKNYQQRKIKTLAVTGSVIYGQMDAHYKYWTEKIMFIDSGVVLVMDFSRSPKVQDKTTLINLSFNQ